MIKEQIINQIINQVSNSFAIPPRVGPVYAKVWFKVNLILRQVYQNFLPLYINAKYYERKN